MHYFDWDRFDAEQGEHQEARALVMSEAFFDELFANASQCGANAK